MHPLLRRTVYASVTILSMQSISAFPSPLSNQPSTSSLNWQNCSIPDAPSLLCAQLEVPLDYDNPQRKTITLGLTKLPALSSTTRVGSLLFNPGGPGSPASASLAIAAQGVAVFTPGVRNRFDIIGLDPRGVGLSTPLDCDPAIANERVSLFPTDEASFQKLLAHNKAYGQSCIERTGDLIYHIDAKSVARDMEAIRVALGDGKLNFLGLSYGTILGSMYLELYPNNIRTLALDGNVDLAVPETYGLIAETSTFENSFNRFAKYCSQNETCALYQKDIPTLFDNLLVEADKKPIPAPGCDGIVCSKDVSSEELLANLENALIVKDPWSFVNSSWIRIGDALASAMNGDATLLSNRLASDKHRSNYPYLAIGCVDWPHKLKTLTELKYRTQLTSSVSPHTRGVTQSWLYQAACLDWPAPVVTPPHLLQGIESAPPILLTNSDHDPETSLVWAVGLLAQIPSGVLAVRKGDGHTSYFQGGTTALAIEHYLLTGEVPLHNTVYDS